MTKIVTFTNFKILQIIKEIFYCQNKSMEGITYES